RRGESRGSDRAAALSRLGHGATAAIPGNRPGNTGTHPWALWGLLDLPVFAECRAVGAAVAADEPVRRLERLELLQAHLRHVGLHLRVDVERDEMTRVLAEACEPLQGPLAASVARHVGRHPADAVGVELRHRLPLVVLPLDRVIRPPADESAGRD